jgi:radical SAM superfamily enzyme YgiQ (UPF0313 family)
MHMCSSTHQQKPSKRSRRHRNGRKLRGIEQLPITGDRHSIRNRKQRVLLLFPPRWDAFAPYLSIPQLAACLRSHGVPVKGSDLNLQLLRWMLSIQGTRKLEASIRIILSAERSTPHEDLAQFCIWAKLWIDDLHEDHRRLRMHLNSRASRTAGDIHEADVLIKRGWSLLEMIESAHGWHPEAPVPQQAFLEGRLKALLAWRPDIIGFSAVTQQQLLAAVRYARKLKHLGCKAAFVAGGAAVSSAFGTRYAQSALPVEIDCFVVGPGEEALLQLVSLRSARRDWPRRIQGRETSSGVVNLPDFSSLDIRGYPRRRYSFPYPLSHGCRWRKCRFCGLYCTRKYCVPEPEQVVQHLEVLRNKYGCTTFYNSGAELAGEDALRIARLLEAGKLSIGWQTMARADRSWTESLCRKLRKAGFEYPLFGIESLSNPVLKLMGKGISSEEQIGALDAACRSGLKPAASLIFDFPGEKIADLETTLESLAPYFDFLSSLTLLRFHLDRTSILAAHPRQFGIEIKNRILQSIERDDIFQVSYRDAGRERAHVSRALRLFDRWIYRINRERSLLFSRSPLCIDFVFDQDYLFEGCHPTKDRIDNRFQLDAILGRRYSVNRQRIKRAGRNTGSDHYHKFLFQGIPSQSLQARTLEALIAGCTVAEAFQNSGVSPRKNLGTFNALIQMINGLDALRVLLPV